MGLRDLLRPFERQQLMGLGPALGDGLDPQLAMQIFQQVTGGAQDRRLQQRQSYGQAAGQLATDAAGMYGPPALSGLAEAYGTSAGLGQQGQGRLQDLVDKLYPGGGATTATLPPEDLQKIDESLQLWASDPAYTLHDAIMHFTTQFRAGGAPEEVITAAKDYITKRWSEYVSRLPSPVQRTNPYGATG